MHLRLPRIETMRRTVNTKLEKAASLSRLPDGSAKDILLRLPDALTETLSAEQLALVVDAMDDSFQAGCMTGQVIADINKFAS